MCQAELIQRHASAKNFVNNFVGELPKGVREYYNRLTQLVYPDENGTQK